MPLLNHAITFIYFFVFLLSKNSKNASTPY